MKYKMWPKWQAFMFKESMCIERHTRKTIFSVVVAFLYSSQSTKHGSAQEGQAFCMT